MSENTSLRSSGGPDIRYGKEKVRVLEGINAQRLYIKDRLLFVCLFILCFDETLGCKTITLESQQSARSRYLISKIQSI